MTIVHEYFPSEFIELQRELRTGYHPTLERILTMHGQHDIDVMLAQIAAYCEVMLDGTYEFQNRMKLCDILRKRLISKRENPNKSIVIIS